MKKMLDELKKLDDEYIVPANFKSNVMNKIKEINLNENKAKNKHFNKYVVSWLSTAAIIIIAITVSLNSNVNKMVNESANDMSNQAVFPSNNLPTSEFREELIENKNEISYDSVMDNFDKAAMVGVRNIYNDIIRRINDNNIKIINSGDNSLIINLDIDKTSELLNDFNENIILMEENENTIIEVK